MKEKQVYNEEVAADQGVAAGEGCPAADAAAADKVADDAAPKADNMAEAATEPTELEKAVAEAAEWKDKFVRLQAEFDNYRKRTLREKMVFAVGNPHARLMLVGEAPGYEEERQGEPFVGPAGQLLTRILGAMGLQRSDVYISNVCKFRPSMGENQGTSNRAPTPEELAACQPLIMAEIRAIQPACIVCLGGSSAKGLLGAQQGVSALRGQWFECQGVPVRVTYHPSYLLRNEALSARRSVWEDMLEVMQRLGMPISEKQQNYFR